MTVDPGRLKVPARGLSKVGFTYPGIPTMISDEEKRYLFWLTSSVWRGDGHVVEIGPWLGGSTFCLAAGMRASGITSDRKLHVFDNFVWREFMGRRASLNLRVGDSFQSHFERNVQDYSDQIIVHRKALPDEAIPFDKYASDVRDDVEVEEERLLRWEAKEPVEILFIDGAKSWKGLRFLLGEFADHLIPQQTLIVCQDYKHWSTYWVPMMFELLRDHFELVHALKFNSVTFRLVSALSAKEVRAIEEFTSLTVQRGLNSLEAAGERLATHGDALGRAIIRTGAVRFLAHKECIADAIERFREVEGAWPWMQSDGNLGGMRSWLSAHINAPLPWSFQSRMRRMVTHVYNRWWRRAWRRLAHGRVAPWNGR